MLKKYGEPLTWIAVLALLYFMKAGESNLSLCVFKFLGFDSCVGCGLGHAVHYALHLDVASSLKEHLLGVPATIFIILHLIHSYIKINKATSYGPTHAYDVTRNAAG